MIKVRKIKTKLKKFSWKARLRTFLGEIKRKSRPRRVSLRIFVSTILIGFLGLGVIGGFFFLGRLQEKKTLEPKLLEVEADLKKAREEISFKSSEIEKLTKFLEQGKEEYKHLESISEAQEAYAKRLETIAGSLAKIAIKQEDLISLEREITNLFIEARRCLDWNNWACFDGKLVQLKVKIGQANVLDSEVGRLFDKIQSDLDFLRRAGLL